MQSSIQRRHARRETQQLRQLVRRLDNLRHQTHCRRSRSHRSRRRRPRLRDECVKENNKETKPYRSLFQKLIDIGYIKKKKNGKVDKRCRAFKDGVVDASASIIDDKHAENILKNRNKENEYKNTNINNECMLHDPNEEDDVVVASGVPQVLQDIQDFLKQSVVQISEKVEGEPRGGSLKDEGTIKRLLMKHPKFMHYIIYEKPRNFGDMVVLDYDEKTKHVVNIKTSIGKIDNAFSKAGIVYALTDMPLESIPRRMNFKKMIELIHTHGKNIPGRDYWFLCVDKNDASNVMIRGARQIRNWTMNINPCNVLQIDWKKEKECLPIHRTWEESYNVLVDGAMDSTKGFFDSLPQEWKKHIVKQVIDKLSSDILTEFVNC